MSDNAIDVRGLALRRGRFALDRIDLRLPRGYIAGFAGPNGSGKTTTIKAVLGLLRPDSGEISVLGGLSPNDPRARERVGIVLDQPTVGPEWRVGSVGRRLGRLYRRWDEPRYRGLLARFAVPGDRRAADLSRGEAVKLSLAMAMAHDPELLVLDEPSTGLDPVSRAELADILREWMIDGERSVLFSTHITSELENLADFAYIIHDGRIVVAGELESLRERFAVARGTRTPPAHARRRLIGLRQDRDRWDALIEIKDTALFGTDVVIDAATTEDVVVYFARRRPMVEEAA